MATHHPSFNHFPLFVLAAAFACGIAGANLFALSLTCAVACGMCAACLCLVAFVKQKLAAASALVVAAFVCAGAILAIVERQSIAADRVRRFYEDGRIASGEPVEVTGVLERAPETAPDGLFLSLGAERLKFRNIESEACGTIELFAPAGDAATGEEYDALELRRGARLRVLVMLTRDERFLNPGVSSLTEFLEREGWDASGTIKSPLLIERLDDERVLLPLAWLDGWRAWLIANVNRRFSGETAGVLNAAMLGNRHGLTHATAESFREGGTFHVLVISGLHITFVGGLVWWLMRRLTTKRAYQWVISALCVWLYAAAVGAEASVVRAALMFTLVALAPVVARRAASLNALGGAALGLLTWRPANLFDPSFQLSFLAVLSITALAWPLVAKLKEAGAWRPTQATPYPPTLSRLWLALGETLFWSERAWRREMGRANHSYQLFKTPLASRLERWRLQTPLRYVSVALAVSACVQVGMLPLLVLYFHRLSFASLLLNVWVGALMVVLSFAALAALLLAELNPAAAAPLIWLAETANRLMTHSADPLTAAGVASTRLPEYAGAPAAVYALYFAPLVVIALALGRWRPVVPPHACFAEEVSPSARRTVRLAVAAHVVLTFVIIFHPLSAGRADDRLRVDFLDVGQGDAALVTLPDGTTLLIDGGGRPRLDRRAREQDEPEGGAPFERDAPSIGERVVCEYLWRRGFGKVDYLLATHADADHIDGLNDVARNFRVAAALVARAPVTDPEFARFAETMRLQKVPIYRVGRGDTLQFGGVAVDVLWPPPTAEPFADAPSGNNDSIVLRMRFGRKTLLLTGDVEAAAEASLVAARDDLHCDVIKVAHHGSKTSSTAAFVAAARPTFAIVSVGLDSPFGHPHSEVLERWRAAGAFVMTTGQRGTITVTTDGNDLQVETYRQ